METVLEEYSGWIIGIVSVLVSAMGWQSEQYIIAPEVIP